MMQSAWIPFLQMAKGDDGDAENPFVAPGELHLQKGGVRRLLREKFLEHEDVPDSSEASARTLRPMDA
jgi:hypothetical protein